MRVYTVQSARKAKHKRVCRRCGHEVQRFETYRYAEPRYGPKLIWCKDHFPKRSELTSSKVGPLYDAQDDFDVSEAEDVDAIKEALQSVADIAREVAEEYDESIMNMPEGLQDGSPVAEEMREKIDVLNDYADTLESWEPSDEVVEEYDPENDREDIEQSIAHDMVGDLDLDDDPEDPVAYIQQHGDESEFTSRVDAELQEKASQFESDTAGLSSAADEASEAVQECEV